MTIPEYAKLSQRSKQSIYQRLRNAGVDRSSLLDDTGNITDEGKSILDRLTAEKNPRSQGKQATPVKSIETTSSSQQQVIDSLTSQVKTLTAEVDRLTADLDRERERNERLEAVQVTLTETVHQLSVDLSQAHTLHAVALPEPRRLRDRIKGIFIRGKA